MKRILHILIGCLLCTQLSFAQCALTVSPPQATYCAGQDITFEINNTPGRTYQITVPALGIVVNDTIATISFPGSLSTQNFPVYVNINNPFGGGYSNCNPFGQPA